MPRVPLSEFRRKLPNLIHQIEQGGIIEITNRGRIVARLVTPAIYIGTADVLLASRVKGRPSRRPCARDVSASKNASLMGTRR
jgi:prevent-host-death family protein